MKKIYLFLCLLASYYFTNAQPGSLDPSFGINGIEKINYKAKGPLVSDKGESYRIELNQGSISTTIKAYKYLSDGTPDLSYGSIGSTVPFSMSAFGSAIEDDGKLLMIGKVQDIYQGDYIVVVHFGLDGSSNYYTKKRPYTSGYLIPAKLIKQGDKVILFSYFALYDVTQPTGQDYIDVFSSVNGGLSKAISPWRTKSPYYYAPNSYYAPNLSKYASEKNVAIEGGSIIVAGPEANQIPPPPLWTYDYSYYIAKYGTGSETFGTNGKIPYPNIGDSRYMLLTPNQKLIIVNSIANPITGNTDFRIFRLNQDGSFDQTFNSTGVQTTDFGGDDAPNSIVLQDDKIIVGGVTTNKTTGEKQFAIARYNDDGTLDNTFSFDGKQTLGEARSTYLLDYLKIKNNQLLAVGTAVSATADSAKVTAAYQLTAANPSVACTATGSILREYWANVTGTLISDIPVNSAPSSTSQLNSFEAPTDAADNYAQRIRGYICAPATGNYTFYISGDDQSELWLSTSDNPADKRKIASVGGMQWTNPKEWTKYESQKSVTIFLQANTKYYIEALNKEGLGGDNLAVGWLTPGSADIVVIPGSVLSPFTGTDNPPVACTATGSILREYWANVTGTLISDIPVTTTPSSTSQLNSFEAPTDAADNYAQRIRGYICAPATGNYTFYISGDDESELWLSTGDNPADKRKIAFVGGMQWTGPREWTKYESQKSITIFLQANTKYYIEALNKEGAGGDNLAVGWVTPGAYDITVIPGSALSPYTATTTNPPVVCTATGTILREYWANVTGTLISDIPVTTTPSSTSQLNSFEAPTDVADYYAQRIRGYICAPATGNYTFYISGDDESELWLSTSDNPADKRKIAFVGGMQWTGLREWSKYESQKSITIFLQANTKYYIEALNKEGAGGDNLAVGWVTPGASDIVVIPGSVLSPFTATDNSPVVCTATGTILREYWANVTGTLISDIPVTTTPSSTSQLNAFEAPTDAADNYAQRIRGYICAPATGNYTFYISGDDESELWLSTSNNPAEKRKIASVGGMQWTNPREWTKFDSQKSVTIFLQANTKYYIEALNKEGLGGDNLAVGWITPGSADIVVIPGSVLSPFTGTTSQPLIVAVESQKISESYSDKVSLSIKALPIPTSTHFTINIKSSKPEPVDLKVVDAVGRVIEIKRKVSANESVIIGDGYQSGIFYLEALQGSERATLKLVKGAF